MTVDEAVALLRELKRGDDDLNATINAMAARARTAGLSGLAAVNPDAIIWLAETWEDVASQLGDVEARDPDA